MIRSFFIAAALVFTVIPVSLSAKDNGKLSVIPYPQSVELGKGQFKAAGASFNCDPAIDQRSQRIIAELANTFAYVCGRTGTFASPVGMKTAAQEGKMKGFIFIKDEAMGPEEYSIDVKSKNCTVKASSFNGFLYAIQTLKQLTNVKVFGKDVDPDEKFMIPCVRISDKPRYAYRGLMLDCSRHFISAEEIKKVLDLMVIFKFNRFQWHLTDDQGWRIEINSYPLLTEVGAFRNGTMVGKEHGTNDGVRYGGYYTKAQIKEIIAYAHDRGIEVIPEIDIPGHMAAALASYPSLSCSGFPREVETQWGIFDSVLCPGKESSFTFIEGVLSEVMELFPYEYIHIGGDECPRTAWESCPDCQAKIKELGLRGDGKHSAEDYLQSYLTSRIEKFVREHGRKAIGWDEIMDGEPAKDMTVMGWRGIKGGIEAASKGMDVIMTPIDLCYLSRLQAKEGEPIGPGFVPLENVYGYEPSKGFDEQMQKHLLGVQACVWTEYITTPEHLEYMLLPRLLAVSELQWCKQSDKDFSRFKEALGNESFKIFNTLGYNYRQLK